MTIGTNNTVLQSIINRPADLIIAIANLIAFLLQHIQQADNAAIAHKAYPI